MRIDSSSLLPALLLGLTPFVGAQDKYVDGIGGSDANTGDSPAAAYATIQKGIDNVGGGASVYIAPATYAEELLVDPGNLVGTGARGPAAFTLEATGAGVVVQWNAPGSRTLYGGVLTTGSGKSIDAGLAVVGASNVVVDGLEFDGNDDMNNSTGTVTSCNVAYVNAIGTVRNCTLHGVQDNPTSGLQGGIAGYVQGGSSNVLFSNCSTYDTQKTFFVGTGGRMDVVGCTITGRGKTNSIAQNGVQYSGCSGRVSGCTITGIWWSGPTWTSTGILPYGPGNPIVVSSNTFVDCQTGVYWIDGGVSTIDLSIEGNTFVHTAAGATNGFDAIDVYDGSSLVTGSWSVTDNVFHEVFGQGLWTNMGGGTISGNTFDDTAPAFGGAQAQDDGPGGNNWDGNNWCDFASNAGFPSTYQIPGGAGAADNTPTSVVPRLQAGVGVATSPSDLPLGPSAVTAADLNADGLIDLVAGLSDQSLGSADKIEVFLNTGIVGGVATFAPGTTYSVGDDPVDLAVADLSGDGNVDLVVVCKGDATVHILAGNGSGAFAAHNVLTFGATTAETAPTGVVAADLSGSAAIDLAISFQGSLLGGGTAKVLRNDGAGLAFTDLGIAGLTLGSGMGIAAGNFDADPALELAIADSGTTLTDDKVRIIDNAGGAFTHTGTLTAISGARSVATGDLDGNGTTDLAVGCFGNGGITTDGGVALFEGDGAGGFSASGSSVGFFHRRGTSAVVIADLDSDSGPAGARTDVVALNLASSNFTALEGYSAGSFGLTRTAASGGTTPVDLVVANLDGDCAPDVIVADLNAGALFIHYGEGTALAQTYGTGCAGIGGTPSIGTFGTPDVPTLGNATFGIDLSGARPFTLAILLGGTNVSALPGACSNLIPTPILFTLTAFTTGAGGAQMPIPVPNSPLLDCLELQLQWAAWDPAGGFVGYSLSDALRVRLGQP